MVLDNSENGVCDTPLSDCPYGASAGPHGDDKKAFVGLIDALFQRMTIPGTSPIQKLSVKGFKAEALQLSESPEIIEKFRKVMAKVESMQFGLERDSPNSGWPTMIGQFLDGMGNLRTLERGRSWCA